jgi:hypothetical protein
MRFVVLLFGLLGVALTAFAGGMFILFDVVLTVLKDNGVGGEVIDFLSASPIGASHGDTGLFLILAAGYGLLGTILGFMRCGWQGALLMLVPVICTSLMNWYTAVFTGILAFTGLLSFLVLPAPIAVPQVKEEED